MPNEMKGTSIKIDVLMQKLCICVFHRFKDLEPWNLFHFNVKAMILKYDKALVVKKEVLNIGSHTFKMPLFMLVLRTD